MKIIHFRDLVEEEKGMLCSELVTLDSSGSSSGNSFDIAAQSFSRVRIQELGFAAPTQAFLGFRTQKLAPFRARSGGL